MNREGVETIDRTQDGNNGDGDGTETRVETIDRTLDGNGDESGD